MAIDPRTLYKLMILYMLHKVNFPLTGTQISDFILTRDYTDFNHLQQSFSELIEASLVDCENIHNTSRYMITDDGEQTLEFFGKNIPAAIVDEMDDYLRENKFKMRSEVSTVADYYKSSVSDYTVRCEVREGKTVVIALELSVPDEQQAEHMCSRWKERSSEIYAYTLKSLMSES